MDERKPHIVCGPCPIIRDWRKLPKSELTRAERTMKFCEKYLIVPDGMYAGEPLVLAEFQQEFIYALLDNPAGTREAILSMAKKNAKSATTACILLSFLCGPEARKNTQIVSGAMSREQAALIFKLAVKMIQGSEKLSKRVRIVPSHKMLIGLSKNTEFKSLASEGSTTQGISAYLAMIDECGQIKGPHSEFVEAIATSQGAHDNPIIIYLSTQAASDQDFLSLKIDNAKKHQNPKTVCHLYAAEDECDLMDEKQWKLANPALGKFRSYTDLANKMQEATQMPSMENSARNLFLNQRISVVSPLVTPTVWKKNGNQPKSLYGVDVYAGLDLSSKTDLTAFVLMGKIDEQWHVHVYCWTPFEGIRERSVKDKTPYDEWAKSGILRTSPGLTVDYDYVVKDIAEIIEDMNIVATAFDRWRIEDLKKSCDAEKLDLKLIPHGQGFRDMAPSIDDLEANLLNARLCHGNNPLLTMAAGNVAIVRDPANGRKMDKQKASGRIDPLVALTMAHGAARGIKIEPAKEFQMFFVG